MGPIERALRMARAEKMRQLYFKRIIAISVWLAMALTGTAVAAVCQFNQSSGAWNVPANWNNCSGGNGSPAGTPGPADRAEISGGLAATLPAGVFPVGELYLQGSSLQGVGIGTTTITTGNGLFTPWSTGTSTLNTLSLNFGLGSGIDTSAGALNLNVAELTTNSGTTIMGPTNISGAGAKIKMAGGTAYRAAGNHTMSAGGEFENQSGVFKAINSITVNGTFQNRGNIEIPAGITLTLGNAAAMTQLDPVFSLIFGDGTLSAPGQTLTLATGGVRGGNLTFNVGTLNNTGAVVRPAPGFGSVGLLTINGNYVQSGTGLVDFNLAGTAPSQYDRMLVSGSVTLGGAISRGAIGTFAPLVGTVLDIITAGSISGSFGSGSETISFDAPRRYVEVISATKVSLRANETVWVVGSTDDVSPTLPSLRNAINRFNAESGSGCVNGPYAIHFFLGTGDMTIRPGSAFSAINNCPGLLIDGYTQSGAVQNTSPTDWNAILPVTFDGAMCGGCTGFSVGAATTEIRGINFTNWPTAINIAPGANNVAIKGNYFFQGNFGVTYNGPAGGVSIGALPNPEYRNVFVKATNAAVQLNGGSFVTVANNLIGLGAGGAVGANGFGVQVNSANDVLLSNNVIANNGKGITVNGGVRTDYRDNNIYANTVIGVDMNNDGPTPNDDVTPPYDTDTGANLLLNFPKILSVTPTSATSANIAYELRSSPSSSFLTCFCLNPAGGNQCEAPVPMCQPANTDATGLFTNTLGLIGLTAGTQITAYTVAQTGPKAGTLSEISPAALFGAPVVTLSTSYPICSCLSKKIFRPSGGHIWRERSPSKATTGSSHNPLRPSIARGTSTNDRMSSRSRKMQRFRLG